MSVIFNASKSARKTTQSVGPRIIKKARKATDKADRAKARDARKTFEHCSRVVSALLVSLATDSIKNPEICQGSDRVMIGMLLKAAKTGGITGDRKAPGHSVKYREKGATKTPRYDQGETQIQLAYRIRANLDRRLGIVPDASPAVDTMTAKRAAALELDRLVRQANADLEK